MTKEIPLADRFWSKVNKTDGCWEWTGCRDRDGYGQINIKNKPLRAHRIAFVLAYGTIPAGLWVLHKCDSPSCVRPDHLWLGTDADNRADMVSKGRGRNGQAKLTAELARSIRSEYAMGGITQAQLAAKYNVKPAQIGNIIVRRSWKRI